MQRNNNTMIVLPSQFNEENIKYSDVKVLSNGGKSVYITYNHNLLIMQTPKMYIPYGVNKYEEPGKPNKYNLHLSFRGKEENGLVNEFYETMSRFDKKIIQDAMTNSISWFKKKTVSSEYLQDAYKPLVKFSKSEGGEYIDKYPPTITIKLPYRDGAFTCDVYNKKKEKVENCDLEQILTKGCKVQVLMQCMGLWFAGTSFGCSWKVLQMKLEELPNKITGFSFLPQGEDDDEEEETGLVHDSDEDLVEQD